jgi:peptidylprolyl isomerase
MRRHRVSFLALAVAATALAATLLSACGSSTPSAALPTVSGAYGTAASPKVHFTSSTAPSGLKVVVLHAGHGPVVTKGQLLVANYLGQIWNGKVFDSSFSRHVAAAFPIGVGHVIKGWDEGLVGKRAGSRILLVVPSKDGYGTQGQSQAGIPGNATLVFVVDLISSYSTSAATPRSPATVQSDNDGVSVTWPAASDPPVVHVAKGYVAPKANAVTVLSRGSGAKVAPGLVLLRYVVVDASTGKVVGSTWQNGILDSESAGIPSQPSVLDKVLGLQVGSRFLLRAPKTKGGPYVFVAEVVAQPSVLR